MPALSNTRIAWVHSRWEVANATTNQCIAEGMLLHTLNKTTFNPAFVQGAGPFAHL